MRDKIKLTGNLAIELKTIIAMTEIYCRDHHSIKEGQFCEDFIEHAKLKLDRCVYGDKKPACKNCPIHCYKPDTREQARIIMRYSGPKMLLKHPLFAIKHLIKATKKFPATIPKGISNYHLRKNKP